jgi:trans-aconitate methyltransferase
MSNQGKSYDLIAADFANLRAEFYKEKPFLDELIKLLQPQAHILDVGCGSGHPIATYLIEQGFQVTGIDGSEKLLAIAKEKCPQMRTLLGDVREIKLAETFDAVLEWWCLFHIPKADHEKMIARFAQWIKPNGFLEFTSGDGAYEDSNANMLNQPLQFYSLDPKDYEKFLKQYGFKIISKEYDQPGHLVWVAQKNA